MLYTTKNTNLLGTSQINGVVAVNLSANINNVTGAGNVVTTIVNADIYNANRKECRADISTFTDKVYGIEDEMLKENQETETQN